MATPFDEASVDLPEDLELPIIKIVSSDLNDWVPIERITKTRKPVIVSTGGSSLKDVDDLVTFFERCTCSDVGSVGSIQLALPKIQ